MVLVTHDEFANDALPSWSLSDENECIKILNA